MAIFYPPPPPFLGGCQPHAPRELSPSFEAVQVDDPPVMSLGGVLIALSYWRELPGLPWTQRYVIPVAAAAAADDPPFQHRGRDQTSLIVSSWQPSLLPAWTGWKLSPALEAVPEDSPPFSHRGRDATSVIVSAWQPGPPYPWLGFKISPATTGVPENDPPFSHRGRDPLQAIVRMWQPDLGPQAQQARHVPASVSAVPEDAPPFGLPSPSLWTVLESWRPAPPLPWTERYFVQVAAPAAADNPPFSHRGHEHLAELITPWMPPAPMPWLGWKVSPAIEAVPVDNPPSRVMDPSSLIVSMWQPQPIIPQMRQAVRIVSGPSVPFPAFRVTGLELGQRSNYLIVTGFNFSLPSTASVRSIQIGVKRRLIFGSMRDFEMRLVLDGNPVGENRASTDYWPSQADWKYYGFKEDSWGTVPAPNQINDSGGFGFAIRTVGEFAGIPSSAEILDAVIYLDYTTTSVPLAGPPDPGIAVESLRLGAGMNLRITKTVPTEVVLQLSSSIEIGCGRSGIAGRPGISRETAT